MQLHIARPRLTTVNKEQGAGVPQTPRELFLMGNFASCTRRCITTDLCGSLRISSVENSWKNSSMSQVAVSMSQVAVKIQWIELRKVAFETRLRTEDQAGKFRAGHDEGGFA